jgi:hypothetical protein
LIFIIKRKAKNFIYLHWVVFVDSGTLTIVIIGSVIWSIREWTAGDDIVRILPGVFLFVVDGKSQSSQSSSSIKSVSIFVLLFVVRSWLDDVDGGGINVK